MRHRDTPRDKCYVPRYSLAIFFVHFLLKFHIVYKHFVMLNKLLITS